jgi:5-methylcytosine-specific restriction enzyme B
MNTADRSISLLDAALRRRFGFVEYMPAAAPLHGSVVGGLSLADLLAVINKRLVNTLGDAARNLQVGHAYFMSKAQPITSVFALRDAIRYDLFPLLQEYCAEDPRALGKLLGEAFYDVGSQRFCDEPFETGKEDAFIAALLAWDPQRLAVGMSEDEPEEDELETDEPDADGL